MKHSSGTLHSSLRWQSLSGYLAVTFVVLLVAAVFLYFEASMLFRAQAADTLVTLSRNTVLHQAAQEPWGDDIGSVQSTLSELQDVSGATVTAFGINGVPSSDGSRSSASQTQNAHGPEVRAALNGETSWEWRNDRNGLPTLYVAIPIYFEDALLGAVQFAYTVPEVEGTLATFRVIIFAALLLSMLAISAVFTLQSMRVGRRLRMLTTMVERITSGDLAARVLTIQHGEAGRLATALNQMADRLQTQTQKRRKERDRLNTVLRTMNDGVAILNRHGEVRSMNPAAAKILGVSLRGSYKRSFVQVAKDFRIAEVWNRCLATNQEQSATIDLSEDVSVHVVITPFLKRRARGYLVVIRDLTQIRRLQTVRQDFVSNVSHELRTPLASLRALVETLRDGALDDPPAAIRFLDRMEVEVDALTQMVQELLELSRIESGRVPLERSPVSPKDIIVPAVERLRAQAERAGLELAVKTEDNLPLVLADAERAQQVVTNLVHNAIKFTPAGGEISVGAVAVEGAVQITVHDTGIGMSRQDLERVFERFYKADRSRAFGGTGLGLSIASHLVQAHGGEIWADSVEDEWSEFGFTLPLAEDMPKSEARRAISAKTEADNGASSATAHESTEMDRVSANRGSAPSLDTRMSKDVVQSGKAPD